MKTTYQLENGYTFWVDHLLESKQEVMEIIFPTKIAQRSFKCIFSQADREEFWDQKMYRNQCLSTIHV